MSEAILRLTSLLDHAARPPRQMSEGRRAEVLEAFSRDEPLHPAPKCMISHSSADAVFGKKLVADLELAGVDCWFAPDDMDIGVRVREGIDEAIRTCDRVIVILSRDAIASPWVESEVENAAECERQSERTILLPIRLDDSVLDARTAWVADMKRKRNIGDFTQWRDDEAYRRALQRLLQSIGPKA